VSRPRDPRVARAFVALGFASALGAALVHWSIAMPLAQIARGVGPPPAAGRP
jgi:hypothetical protein